MFILQSIISNISDWESEVNKQDVYAIRVQNFPLPFCLLSTTLWKFMKNTIYAGGMWWHESPPLACAGSPVGRE